MPTDEMNHLFETAERNVYRLETLPFYTDSPGEREAIQAWREGKPDPRPIMGWWIKNLHESATRGCQWRRVHTVRRPLTEYLRWEFESQAQRSIAEVEDVRVADIGEHPELAALDQDYWMFDERVVILMHYDEDNRFIGTDRVDDVGPYLEIRDLAWRHAVPVGEYLDLVGEERDGTG